MSYSEEKDEIDRLFGVAKEQPDAYSQEVGPQQSSEPPPLPQTTQPPQQKPAPLPMTPLATNSGVADEELIVYESVEAPDFPKDEFISFDTPKIKEIVSPEIKEESTLLQVPQQIPPARKTEEIPRQNTPTHQATPTQLAPQTIQHQAPPPARTVSTSREFVSDANLEKINKKDLLLDSRNLVKIYDGRTVVNEVSINVKHGEIVGLLGPNGAGKTTSFYMIVGLVPANGGQVFFNGNDVTSQPMYIRARQGMGYLPQEESIFRKLTVEQNIMAVMETLKIPKRERKERCEELLERFSITHIRNNLALTCSGGEKRRVTIARSLVTKPSLLMLDEPFSGVDPIAVNEIQGIVQELRDSGLAILITDHNARQTLELVDRAYLIFEGRVLREGSQEFLVNDPVSRELYLGDSFTM